MYIQQLKKVIISRKLRGADIAHLASVSRACVSKWFSQGEKSGWCNVETNTLKALSAALNLDPAFFLKKPIDLSTLKTRFLWDRIYPDMEGFIVDLRKEKLVALARLAQVLGFGDSLRIVGKKVIKRFPQYKKFLKPVRRMQLETLWPLYASQQ